MTEYWQRKKVEAEKRLRSVLDKPIATDPQAISVDHFDPWIDLLDGCVGSYSEELDDLAVEVLKAVQTRTTFNIIEGPHGLAAELFMHMLADWLCDYGTSPRGVFPFSVSIKEMWPELIDKWEAYAKIKWSDA